MNTSEAEKPAAVRGKRARTAGTACVWPTGVQAMFGISAPTRWRWERLGLLPARDVFLAGRPVGWKPETLAAAQRGQPA